MSLDTAFAIARIALPIDASDDTIYEHAMLILNEYEMFPLRKIDYRNLIESIAITATISDTFD